MMLLSCAGLSCDFIDWQFRTKIHKGKSFLFISIFFVGDDVAVGWVKLTSESLFDEFKNESEFDVSNIVVLKMHVEKFGNPQLQHSQDILVNDL